MPRWTWKLQLFYKYDNPYHKAGDLAIETVHADSISKDMELLAANGRDDIGRIVQINLVTGDTNVLREGPS